MENHTEKQKIFDEYAKEQGFTDFMHFVSSSLLDSAQLCNHIFSACNLVQKEQQKRIVENIKSYGIQRAWEEAESRTFNHEKSLIFEIL